MSRRKNRFLLAKKKIKPTASAAVVVERVEIVIIAVRPYPDHTDRLQDHIIYIYIYIGTYL